MKRWSKEKLKRFTNNKDIIKKPSKLYNFWRFLMLDIYYPFSYIFRLKRIELYENMVVY